MSSERDHLVLNLRQPLDSIRDGIEAYVERLIEAIDVLYDQKQHLATERSTLWLSQQELKAALAKAEAQLETVRRQNLDGSYVLALLAKVNGGTLTLPRWVLDEGATGLSPLTHETAPDGSIVFTLKGKT